jgi:hypothetical protein
MMRKIIIAVIIVCMVMVAVPVLSSASPDRVGAEITPKTPLFLDPVDEAVSITKEDAIKSAEMSIPDITIRKVTGGLIQDRVYGKIWQFSVITGEGDNLLIGIDPKTGELDFYYGKADKKTVTREEITVNEAKQIADDYIKTQNIKGELLFDEVEYRPPRAKDLAGKYSVHFWRIIKGIPCLSDGVRVGVNPETGDVMSYQKTWTMPEEKIAVTAMPGIQDSEAQQIVRDLMKEKYSTDITVISSRPVWVDMDYLPGTNDCHDIRLTWWIRFNDSYLQENEAEPGSAWIDAHSGEFLKKAYFV